MPRALKTKTIAYLALLTTITIWGFSAIVSKEAYEEVSPFILFFLRFAIGLILVAPFMFLRKKDPKIPTKELPKVAFFGFLLAGVSAGGWVIGLYFTTASRAAIISTAGPILTIVLSRLILKRKERLSVYIGTAIGLLGALTIVFKPIIYGEPSEAGNLMFLGDILIFISAFGASLFSVLEVREKESYHAYQKIAVYFAVACLFAIPFALIAHSKNPNWVLTAGNKAWFGILYYGIGCSAIAYLFYQWGVENTSALESSLFFYLQPFITVIAAMIILKESPTPVEWIGGTLVMLGVLIAMLFQKQFPKKAKH